MLLWRLSESGDPLIGKSVLTNYTHHEPIQKLQWTRDPSAPGYVLASVSADGKMILWSPSDVSRPAAGFQLVKPSSARQRLAAGGAGGGMIEGAAAFGFSKLDPSTFVAGLETWTLHKGSLIANEERSLSSILAQRGELPWSKAAALLMTRVPACAGRSRSHDLWVTAPPCLSHYHHQPELTLSRHTLAGRTTTGSSCASRRRASSTARGRYCRRTCRRVTTA